MNRTICLILTMAILLSVFTGCGGQNTEPPATTETEAPLGPAVDVYWFTENGDFLTLGNVGRTPVPPEVEQTVMTEKFVYTFTGWDKVLAPIRAEDVENGSVYYRAVYDRVKRKYNVNFVADGQIIETLQCEYGAPIPTPTVKAPAKYGYAHAEWMIDPNVQVTGDLTVNAGYANRIGYTLSNNVADVIYGLVRPSLSNHLLGEEVVVVVFIRLGYPVLVETY